MIVDLQRAILSDRPFLRFALSYGAGRYSVISHVQAPLPFAIFCASCVDTRVNTHANVQTKEAQKIFKKYQHNVMLRRENRIY